MKFLFHIPIALILFFIAAAIVTVYLVTQTTLVHRSINLLLAQYIESQYDVKIEYGDIGGSLLEYLSVDNVRVDFEGPSQRYRLAKIKRIEAYYNINNLWHGIWRLDSLHIFEPTVILRSDSTGKLLIPKIASKTSQQGESQQKLALGRMRLSDGRFQWFQTPSVFYADSINLVGSVSVSEGVVNFRLDSLSLSYPQKQFHLKQMKLNAVLANKVVGVDSLLLVTDSSRLSGGGIYPLDKTSPYSFSFQNSHFYLPELSTVTRTTLVGNVDFTVKAKGLGADISGNADLDGTLFERRLGPVNTDFAFSDGILSFKNLKGAAFDGQMEGIAELNLVTRPETYSCDLKVADFNLDKIMPETFMSKISGRLQGNGSGFSANDFNLDIDVDCGRGRFDFVNYDSLSGTVSVNVNDMYFHPGFSLSYKHSTFSAEGVVDYGGEMNLNGNFHTSQLADFWGDLFIKRLSGGGSATYVVTGWNSDPDIRGVFRGDSCSIYGCETDSLSASFDIKSFLYRRQGKVEGRTWKSNVWDLPADSVLLAIGIDSNLVSIDTASLYHSRYSLGATGNAILHDSTASVQVNHLDFQFDSLRYVNSEPFPVEFLANGINVDRLHLHGKEGDADISCHYGYDSSIVLTAACDSFHFAPWLVDLGLDSLTNGVMNLDGKMTGKLKNPEIVLKGSINELTYGQKPLGILEADLHLADSSLVLNDMTLHFIGGDLKTTGNFPLVMNLDSGQVFVPQSPMKLTMSSAGTDLSVLSSLNPYLESLTGDYKLQMDIYGTPQQPLSHGSFELNKGTLKVYQMENPIEDLQAQISSQDKRVSVDWVEGKVRYKKREGSVRATGNIVIRNKDVFDYDLDIVGTTVPFKYDLGDIFGVCDFDLTVKGYRPPTVEGSVTVSEATYADEFETEQVTAALEAADTSAAWDYTINMEMLPASVTVKNSDVNMVLGGNLSVVRKAARDNYLGVLDIARGNFYLFDLNFKIEDGSTMNFNDVTEPNPALAINVSTQIRNYTTGVTSSSYDKLDLVIGGTLQFPKITTAAGSVYSDEDILSIVLANPGAQKDSLGTSSFQQRLQGFVAARTSQALARRIGVETFEIAPVYNEKNTLASASVSVGLQTLPNVYTYISSLSLDGKADYGAESRFGKHFFLGLVRDRDNLWRLNLNLNWEFK